VAKCSKSTQCVDRLKEAAVQKVSPIHSAVSIELRLVTDTGKQIQGWLAS